MSAESGPRRLFSGTSCASGSASWTSFALLFGLNLFSLIISGLNAASGFLFAYFFYHTFIVLRKKRYLICGFGMICVYIAMMLMAASVSLINPFGFGFSVAKALANAILALHAWQLVQLAPEEETRGPFDRAAQQRHALV